MEHHSPQSTTTTTPSNAWFLDSLLGSGLQPPVPKPEILMPTNVNPNAINERLNPQEIKEWDLAVFDFLHQSPEQYTNETFKSMKGIQSTLNWAIILRSQRRLADAQQVLEKMLDDPPVIASKQATLFAVYLLGLIQFDQKHYTEALSSFVHAMRTISKSISIPVSVDFTNKEIQLDSQIHSSDILFALACSFFMCCKIQLKSSLVSLQSKTNIIETIKQCVSLASLCNCGGSCVRHDFIRMVDSKLRLTFSKTKEFQNSTISDFYLLGNNFFQHLPFFLDGDSKLFRLKSPKEHPSQIYNWEVFNYETRLFSLSQSFVFPVQIPTISNLKEGGVLFSLGEIIRQNILKHQIQDEALQPLVEFFESNRTLNVTEQFRKLINEVSKSPIGSSLVSRLFAGKDAKFEILPNFGEHSVAQINESEMVGIMQNETAFVRVGDTIMKYSNRFENAQQNTLQDVKTQHQSYSFILKKTGKQTETTEDAAFLGMPFIIDSIAIRY